MSLAFTVSLPGGHGGFFGGGGALGAGGFGVGVGGVGGLGFGGAGVGGFGGPGLGGFGPGPGAGGPWWKHLSQQFFMHVTFSLLSAERMPKATHEQIDCLGGMAWVLLVVHVQGGRQRQVLTTHCS